MRHGEGKQGRGTWEAGPRNAFHLFSRKGPLSGKQCARKRASTCLGRDGEKRAEKYLARRLLYFFGSLKEECVGNRLYQSHEEARLALFIYLEIFYNRLRRHLTLGYMSPLMNKGGDKALKQAFDVVHLF